MTFDVKFLISSSPLFPKERQKNIEGESSCISEVVAGFSESFIVFISGISSSTKITFTANTVYLK